MKNMLDRQTDRQTDRPGQGELTGFPSIDKPWLKYYSEEAISAPLPRFTMYEHIKRENMDHQDQTAINYMGKGITYGALFKEIDRAAVAFYALGLRKGDIVTGIAPLFPEIIYCIYGLNKIGVLTDWFDLRTDKQTIVKEIGETKSKVLLAFDEYLPGFEKYLDESGIETVISFSKASSLPLHLRVLAGMKKPKKVNPSVAYWDFIRKYAGSPVPETVKDAADLPALLEHTGGTTGTPKAVILTNYNVTSSIEQYRRTGAPYERGQKYLTVGFPFTAYALVGTLHNPLVVGIQCCLCFTLDIAAVEKMILNNKINQTATTPMTWEQMLHSRRAKNADLSFVVFAAVGADELDVRKEEEINEFLKNHHCPVKIAKGYGMTELASSASVTPCNEYNKPGSVGLPYPKNTFSVFEPGTEKEYTYGEVGEICISGPTVMQGYFNRPEETASVLKRHRDGKLWLHSGDLGYIDKDGFLFLNGRIKRMFMNHMAFKIFPSQIEKVIMQCEGVEQCCVVGRTDIVHNVGKITVAFVIPKGNAEDIEESVKKLCRENLPEWQRPQEYVFVDKFPYTGAGKVDYRLLEKRAEDGELS